MLFLFSVICVLIYRETLFEPCRNGSYRVHYEFPSVGLTLKKFMLLHWSRNVLVVRNSDGPLPCWQNPAWGNLVQYFSDIKVWSHPPVTVSGRLVLSSIWIAQLKSCAFRFCHACHMPSPLHLHCCTHPSKTFTCLVYLPLPPCGNPIAVNKYHIYWLHLKSLGKIFYILFILHIQHVFLIVKHT